MTAKEARELMPQRGKTIEEVFTRIRVQSRCGDNFTYAEIDSTTVDKLEELGYRLEYISHLGEYKITW